MLKENGTKAAPWTPCATALARREAWHGLGWHSRTWRRGAIPKMLHWNATTVHNHNGLDHFLTDDKVGYHNCLWCPAWVSHATRFEHEGDAQGLAAALFSEKVKGKMVRDHPEFPGNKAGKVVETIIKILLIPNSKTEQNDCGVLHPVNAGNETSQSL